MDDYDEDDGPIVFKRANSTKKNQSKSEVKKPCSQRNDGIQGRQGSDVRPSNGQSSTTIQKGKMTSIPYTSNTSPPVKSPLTNRKSPLPVKNLKPSTSATNNQSKNSALQNASAVVKEEKPSSKPNEDSIADESDEDNKPISARILAGSSKSNSNHGTKRTDVSSKSSPLLPVQKTRVVKNDVKNEVKNESSDYEAPLSSRLPVNKSNNTASTSKAFDPDEKKPLASKVQQNGSAKYQIKTSSSALKRPIGEIKSSGQALVKKPRLSDTSGPTNSKPVVSAKAEQKSDDSDDDDDDHVPISKRKRPAVPDSKSSAKQKVTKVVSPSFKKTSKSSKHVMKNSTYSKSLKVPPGSGEGQKWTTLVHNGVIFPPPYKPHGVKMLYKGQPVDLTPEQEEVATMFAVMLDTDYMSKPKFKENFMSDWKKILGKNHVIRNLEDCDFTPIYEWHQREKEKKKQMSTEEKKAIKEEKMKQEEKYMWAVVDGVKEKVGNFRVEPPGLFRGRGEHPKMGKLKKRIHPSDITINIGRDAPVPECPIPGQRWKEVKHDNTVTWLAFWNDPVNLKECKYVFLAASSSLKGQSDKDKYEKARMLKDYIHGIRAAYTKDFASKDVAKQQIAVATYLIDKLALRAGNEKDDDEADTVGCCTLKVENVEPKPPNILKFDFLGKDSIRYQNEVEVELPVYKAIQQFRTGKDGADDLFDKLDTSKLNAHLKALMPGLTAKVFRTYNASITLDDMLNKETKGGDLVEKVAVYQHANKEVAIICNHQRSVSKSHSAQMTRLNEKIDELKGVLEELQTDLSRAKKGKPPLKSADGKPKRNLNPEALEKKINQTNAKIEKMERDKETKEDLKTVALGTSKLNYLDPRITVAWCKRHDVPIEKMFNKSCLAKFAWAMDVDPSFRF